MEEIIPLAGSGYTALMLHTNDAGYSMHPVIAWRRLANGSIWPLTPGVPVDDEQTFDAILLPDGRVYDLNEDMMCDDIEEWWTYVLQAKRAAA